MSATALTATATATTTTTTIATTEPQISDEQLVSSLREIMRGVDLITATPKHLRSALENKYVINLKPRKEFIKQACKKILAESEFQALIKIQIASHKLQQLQQQQQYQQQLQHQHQHQHQHSNSTQNQSLQTPSHHRPENEKESVLTDKDLEQMSQRRSLRIAIKETIKDSKKSYVVHNSISYGYGNGNNGNNAHYQGLYSVHDSASSTPQRRRRQQQQQQLPPSKRRGRQAKDKSETKSKNKTRNSTDKEKERKKKKKK